MRKVNSTPAKGAVNAGFKTKPSINNLRGAMKYKISTTSTTASGVVPIKGATKYPAEPAIYFTREAWVKQCHLVHKCTMEVGWFALVDYDEESNSFTITELVIPCQEVTAAETDIGKEDLADAAMELIEAGKDTSKMYAWFHSHVNMSVSPSAQDEYQVEDFLEDLADQPEVPAFIRGIQNKKGELKLDVYYIQHGIAYQNVEFAVIHDDDPQWLTDIDSEITAKVTARTYQQYGGYGGGRQTTGKSQSGNAGGAGKQNGSAHSGWDYGGGYSEGFRGYYEGFDEYNDIYDFNTSEIVEVSTSVGNQDILNAPKALTMDYMEYAELEVVYQSPSNVEVLLGTDGKLLVCDANGDIYDYTEYTETYGEVDGNITVVV
ncbi:MAG: hypothetical protein DRR42_11340 [Gammaproteobacteria bacterium]|nr:MAG: hypothetical protein DRR42_11340 [Gammaproteobacteria bacterium]